jgi:copper chaperone NosL
MLWAYAGYVYLLSVVAIIDFWRWEHAYGHNLDPNAPISIPGMSYQPPLLGYKKLLNFEAYSAPHGGGWFYIGSVTLITLAVIYELYRRKKAKERIQL